MYEVAPYSPITDRVHVWRDGLLLAGELLTLGGASKWHGLIRVAAGRGTQRGGWSERDDASTPAAFLLTTGKSPLEPVVYYCAT